MRIFPLSVSILLTAVLIYALDTPLPSGKTKTPRLGYFLSPQYGFWQNAEATNTDYNASVQLTDLNANADVYIDDRLVPHIYAENDADAYYIQGYLHAKFRLWQMEFQTHAAAGRVSEIIGSAGLKTDMFLRRVGLKYGAERAFEAMKADTGIQAAVDRYAAGVNAYIKTLNQQNIPFEYKLLSYSPEEWTAFKSALFLKFMSFDLAGRSVGMDLQMTNTINYFGWEDFEKLYSNVQDSLDPIVSKGTIYSAPAIMPKAPADLASRYGKKKDTSLATAKPPIEPNENNGSNNWVVAGSKTKSGRPILSNDPHLGLNLPSLWFEIQISTPTHNTYGASFPGSPNVILGFNDSIAWGVTNAGRDVMDLFEMKFKDTTLQEYWFNGAWQKAEQRKEVFKVKGGEDITHTIAITNLGPLMYDRTYKSDNNNPTNAKNLALRWTAHDPSNELRTFYRLNHAKNYADYLDAISTFVCPGQNFAFASKTGDIAVKQQGRFIARWKRQGDFVMPGEDSSYMWQGFIPVNENPLMLNPARGFVSSANQMATDSTYPYYLGAATLFPLQRGITINKMLDKMTDITPDDMMQLQQNYYNAQAAMGTKAILKFTNESKLDADAVKYVQLLKTWDFVSAPNSKASTVFYAVFDSLVHACWDDDLKAAEGNVYFPYKNALIDALLKDSIYHYADDIFTKDKIETIQDMVTIAWGKAAKQCKEWEAAGKLEWTKFKDAYVKHLTELPALSRQHLTTGGWGSTINAITSNHGPSWRMIVHMTDELEAYGIYPGGQNGNPGSKYYDISINDWAKGTYYKLLFIHKKAAATNTQMKWIMHFTKA